MLPLLVILGVAYLVYWLPPREIGTSSTLAITALPPKAEYSPDELKKLLDDPNVIKNVIKLTVAIRIRG